MIDSVGFVFVIGAIAPFFFTGGEFLEDQIKRKKLPEKAFSYYLDMFLGYTSLSVIAMVFTGGFFLLFYPFCVR